MRISGISYVSRRTHKVRNTFVTLFVLVLLLFLSVSAVTGYYSWKITHPDRKEIAAFTSNIVPEYNDVSFSDINDKVKLSGWYFSVKDSNRTVIFSHSYAENRLQFGEKTIDLVKAFIDSGINVLLFDYRCSGNSQGSTSSVIINETDDLLGAVKYAKSKGAEHIYLMGFSSGASLCLLAAAKNKENIDAIIVDSPFLYADQLISSITDLPTFPFGTTINYGLKFLTRSNAIMQDPFDKLRSIIPTPMLVIHSLNDSEIPFSSSKSLYNFYSSLVDEVELWETQAPGHAASFERNPNLYIEKVLQFIANVAES